MKRVHTHYDNLKVARDASPEAIRDAYKRLSRQYHPDRNPDNADAERIMAIINVAYTVLSDPVKRREHDRWVAQQERGSKPVSRMARLRKRVQAKFGVWMKRLLKKIKQ